MSSASRWALLSTSGPLQVLKPVSFRIPQLWHTVKPRKVPFQLGLHCLFRWKTISRTSWKIDMCRLKIQSGQMHAHCISMSGKTHRNGKDQTAEHYKDTDYTGARVKLYFTWWTIDWRPNDRSIDFLRLNCEYEYLITWIFCQRD